MSRQESTSWALRYPPKTVAEAVLDDDKRKLFTNMIETKNFFSMILHGSAGIGKTSMANVIVKEVGAEYLFINASLERGIDVIRSKIAQFASTMSLDNAPKFVILDEADSLTNEAQLSLRALMEREGRLCTFILTCNFPGRIIEPLHSRCKPISLAITDKPAAMKQFAMRIIRILKENDVKYTNSAVGKIVKYNYPDFRKTLTDIQTYAVEGDIDDEAAARIQRTSNSQFYDIMRTKDFPALYEWIMSNVNDPVQFLLGVSEKAATTYTGDTLIYAISHLNDGQFQMQTVPDKHLTLLATLAKVMSDSELIKE